MEEPGGLQSMGLQRVVMPFLRFSILPLCRQLLLPTIDPQLTFNSVSNVSGTCHMSNVLFGIIDVKINKI